MRSLERSLTVRPSPIWRFDEGTSLSSGVDDALAAGVAVRSGLEVVPPREVGEWAGGQPATSVEVPVSGGVTRQFENGAYTRYIGGAPQEVLSEFDGQPEPFMRDTVILLVANQKFAGYTDSAGADVPTFDVVGGGDLYVFHAGEVIEGTWMRGGQDDEYLFMDSDGSPVSIASGTTQFVVVPKGEPVSINS